MLISTMNDLPGYRIEAVVGEVFGLTAHSHHVDNLEESRLEAIERLTSAAAAKGADAVVSMRFDTTEMGGTWSEVCAYGTACRVTKL